MLKLLKILCIFVLSIFFAADPRSVHAITKFDTKYQVYYKVSDDGNTNVTFVINQKNNLSIVYATEYGISLNETKINNLKITDDGVVVSNPSMVKSQNQTVISFPFVNKVVGKNKIRNFTIEYDTPDIVSKQGSTWQINIPRFESNESVSEQTAILSLPEKFPQPAYIDPKPDIVNNNTYYFSSKSMANKPISAIFGKAQYFQSEIKYHLSNEQNIKNTKSITLVPNTGYQTVQYRSIVPTPEKVQEDNDGNLLAFYALKPNESLDIVTTLDIKTDFQPKSSNLTIVDQKYLESNQIWNFDHAAFTTPEIKNLSYPKAIYDFVTNRLKYDYQKINESGTLRQPASEVLKNSLSAICTDFTDLFVALARRAGIPARELEGIALSDNQDLKPISNRIDLLHAWPEYFDKEKGTWIQVDPTWANTTKGLDYFTKLDFNHIVFAIHGATPLEPIPAGGFKNKNKQERQIQITPAQEITFTPVTVTPSLVADSLKTNKITLQNDHGGYFYGQVEVLENKQLKPASQNVRVPPYSRTDIIIETKPFSFFETKSTDTKILINGKEYTVTTPRQQTGSAVLLAIGGLILAAVTYAARSLLLRRRK